MKHDQKCRVLKMVLASLQNAIVANPSNKPANAGQPAEAALTEAQVNSALDVVNSVLKQPEDPSVDANLSAVDIAALVLQILQLILSHFPGGASPAPAPAPAPAIDATSILTIAETIMQILELILSKLPKSVSPAPAAVRESALSATDIAGLVLAILQLLLSKFGTPAPAPAPAPGSAS
ncbi:MAG: hypothetical protein KGS72_26245 [Cyanobacteria bacterium REEB67]|nr:hypothetical protein [Cyanobacteria bacterium REEB67]